MRLLLVTAASLGLLVLPLGAQTAPGVITGPAANPAFAPLGTGVTQIYLDRLPGDPPGTWTACITQAATLVLGAYDQVNGTFTPTQEAAALNSGSPFGLMLEPTLGRHAVFDRSTGVFFATRAAPGMPFTTAAQVTGVPGTYVDPAIGYVGGKLKLFYVLAGFANAIIMQDLDITNPQSPFVSGPAVQVAVASASSRVHSPTPITGPDGDVEGLWMAERISGDSDMYFKPTLDPLVPQILAVDGTNWRNNGGVAGGHLLYSDSGKGIYEVESAWLLGDEELPGGTLDVFGAVANTTGLAITTVFLSTGVRAPLQLPPPLDKGALGLDLTVVVGIGGMSHSGPSQMGAMQIGVPNDPALKGVRAAIQGVSLVPQTVTYAFTNTAWVRVL